MDKRLTSLCPLVDSYAIAQGEIDGAFRYMDQSLVMAYELGNEVNLYGNYRPSNYDVNAYASQMRDWIPRLRARSSTNSRWQFPSFAGPSQWFRSDMNVARLVSMGVPQSITGIEYLSVHGYPRDVCSSKCRALGLFWASRRSLRPV